MLRAFFSIAFVALLAACSSGTGPSRSPSNAVTAPNFSDNKPVTTWGGRPPQAYQVHGIDIARYQSAIDWNKARANGVNFAFI